VKIVPVLLCVCLDGYEPSTGMGEDCTCAALCFQDFIGLAERAYHQLELPVDCIQSNDAYS
jgi:hypothetical protein